MKFIKNIGIALLFLVAITFSLQNNETVLLKYYYLENPIEIPLYLLVFVSVIFGILIGGVEGLFEKIRNGSTIRRLRKDLAAREKELTSLRNLPLTESKVVEPELIGEEKTSSTEA